MSRLLRFLNGEATLSSLGNNAKVSFTFEYSYEGNKLGIGNVIYSVDGAGKVGVTNDVKVTDPEAPEFPRFGLNLVMPREFDEMNWLGRGSHKSYWDRKTSAFVDVYSGAVADQYWPYIRPQENGSKTDVRWMGITNKDGVGLKFLADKLLEVSAHHNIMEDFESPVRTDGRQKDDIIVSNRHTNDVKPCNLTSANVDYKQMEVGGDTSWGARTHNEYRLTRKSYQYSFRIEYVK